MANPTQMTEKMRREFEDFYRIFLHIKDETRTRADAPIGPATPPTDIPIILNYKTLDFYNRLTIERLHELWRKLDLWTTRHPGIPESFNAALGAAGPKIKLRKMMAVNNELTVDQRSAGQAARVDEEWTVIDSGFNRYQALFEIIDSLVDHSVILGLRFDWWIDEWTAQGSSTTEVEVIAILKEYKDSINTLNSFLTDLAVQIRNEKGESETTVDELTLRNSYLKIRNQIPGGIESINRGYEFSGSPVSEYDPDIDTVRDFPNMGSDVV